MHLSESKHTAYQDLCQGKRIHMEQLQPGHIIKKAVGGCGNEPLLSEPSLSKGDGRLLHGISDLREDLSREKPFEANNENGPGRLPRRWLSGSEPFCQGL